MWVKGTSLAASVEQAMLLICESIFHRVTDQGRYFSIHGVKPFVYTSVAMPYLCLYLESC